MEDFFGSVLIDRGDRESWTGDAHPIQAAALVAFHNLDSIKQNLKASISGAGGGFPTYVRVDNSVAPPSRRPRPLIPLLVLFVVWVKSRGH